MFKNDVEYDWSELYPSSVTVCDVHGVIVAMNSASRKNFSSYGSGSLIGTSLFDCHPEAANIKIRKMLHSHLAETYIVEKKGRKRLVHQAPWYKQGEFAGLVETIIDLVGNIQEYKRN